MAVIDVSTKPLAKIRSSVGTSLLKRAESRRACAALNRTSLNNSSRTTYWATIL
jgi:hypothetical protein